MKNFFIFISKKVNSSPNNNTFIIYKNNIIGIPIIDIPNNQIIIILE